MRKTIGLILGVLMLLIHPFNLLAGVDTSTKRVDFSTAGFFKIPELRNVYNLNLAWRFFKGDVKGAESVEFNDKSWRVVNLPDGMELLPEEASGCINTQGIVWYRKHFSVPMHEKGKRVIIYLEGVMGKSKVWVNGELVKKSMSGYLPLVIDVTNHLAFDHENVIAVCADNTDEPAFPPGKSQTVLDFTYMGGIYRNVWLYTTNKVFITDPNEEESVAGGGLFVAYKNVSEKKADVALKIDVRNNSEKRFSGWAVYTFKNKENQIVLQDSIKLKVNKNLHFQSKDKVVTINNPHLWSPASPYLYNLEVVVKDTKGMQIDGYRQRIGIRSIEFKGEKGLYINGKHYDKPLMGANRHQDFALIGHALPNLLHWRDAKKLKDLGMEVIRSAHYPQSPAWMDACDELGLFMILTTPGWQYWNEAPTFENGVYDNIRDMVRRDRNHACVFLWEPILNETWYPDYFAKRVKDIVNEEYPYPYCYSACDFRSRGREHFKIWYENAINFDKKDKVNEEYKGITCFQREWGDCVDDWTAHNGPSRVSRSWGEVPMLLQAEHYAKTNFKYISYDAFFRTTPQFVGGCMWHPFDHQRGYHPDPFYGGLMNAYRLPKTSYYLFKSFRSPIVDKNSLAETGPFVYVANEMTPFSPTDVTVYSNCDKVVLTVNKNGKQFVYERKEQEGAPYPIIKFKDAFSYYIDKVLSDTDSERGENRQDESFLLAEGFIGGKKVAEHMQRPARRPERILLEVDDEGKSLVADGSDKMVIVASVVDKNGEVKRLNNSHIRFYVEGEASIVGNETQYANPKKVEWGTAPIILQATHKAGKIKVYAEMDYKGSQRPLSGMLEFQSIPSLLPSLENGVELQQINNIKLNSDSKISSDTNSELQREVEKLRKELNTLKLKEVSSQQGQFNTAAEHK